jgi:hypothetical protein
MTGRLFLRAGGQEDLNQPPLGVRLYASGILRRADRMGIALTTVEACQGRRDKSLIADDALRPFMHGIDRFSVSHLHAAKLFDPSAARHKAVVRKYLTRHGWVEPQLEPGQPADNASEGTPAHQSRWYSQATPVVNLGRVNAGSGGARLTPPPRRTERVQGRARANTTPDSLQEIR